MVCAREYENRTDSCACLRERERARACVSDSVCVLEGNPDSVRQQGLVKKACTHKLKHRGSERERVPVLFSGK